jgi:hypothetical protein
MAFFDTSTRNLLAAERGAGVGHHIALSVVGADRMPDSGYMRAKVNQESLIKAGGVPYSIVRATQFFEFLGGIADSGAEGDTVRLSGRRSLTGAPRSSILAITGKSMPSRSTGPHVAQQNAPRELPKLLAYHNKLIFERIAPCHRDRLEFRVVNANLVR